MSANLDIDKAREIVSQVKARLVLDQPFFASLACGSDFEARADLNPPTMATDGKRIFFHPQWVHDHTLDENLFVVCHEVMHKALGHIWRLHGLDMRIANIAADIIVNELLCREGVGVMPKEGIRDTKLFEQGGGTFEGVYPLVRDKYFQPKPPGQQGQGPGQPGQGQPQPGQGDGAPDLMDKMVEPDASMSQSERDAAEAEAKMELAGAIQAAKMRGKLPGHIARVVEDVLNPKTNWKEALRRFFTESANEYRTWAKPNRRFASQGIYMPGLAGERMGVALIGNDASGSINQAAYDRACGEIRKVVEDTRPTRVEVGVFDTRICEEHVFEEGDEVYLKAYAGGGTNFAPVAEWAKTKEDAALLLILTDGHCNSFGTPPDVPVLWGLLGDNCRKNFEPPYGDVIYIKE